VVLGDGLSYLQPFKRFSHSWKKLSKSLSLLNFQKPINTGLSLAGLVVSFFSLECQEGVERGFGVMPGFQWLWRQVPSLLRSLCSLGSFNKQALDQLWFLLFIAA
jgi:hypothetical protein